MGLNSIIIFVLLCVLLSVVVLGVPQTKLLIHNYAADFGKLAKIMEVKFNQQVSKQVPANYSRHN
jgi:hypothetical protein